MPLKRNSYCLAQMFRDRPESSPHYVTVLLPRHMREAMRQLLALKPANGGPKKGGPLCGANEELVKRFQTAQRVGIDLPPCRKSQIVCSSVA